MSVTTEIESAYIHHRSSRWQHIGGVSDIDGMSI